MRFGVVILPEHRWRDAAPTWRRAEELGFDHAWTYDHLAWRSFRDSPWFGAIPLLTAAATATTRIRLGTLVASPNFRHPVPFAKELLTLDDVSGGRFTLGIGAGALTGWDTTVLGHPPWSAAERADRFEEFLDLTDRLLREPETTYHGRYYAADGARTYPGCVQEPRIPFAVAGQGRRGMALAAKFGASWVTIGDRNRPEKLGVGEGVRVLAEQMARLDAACDDAGRDPRTIDRLVLTGELLDAGLNSPESHRDAVGRYAEIGVTDMVVPWPRPGDPYKGDLATFERIFSAL